MEDFSERLERGRILMGKSASELVIMILELQDRIKEQDENNNKNVPYTKLDNIFNR
jgi:hypothetical protein